MPFNLQLLVSLLESDAGNTDGLHAVRTQLELLDAYWEARVTSPPAGRDSRELAATRLCERAIQLMRLRVPRAGAEHETGPTSGLNELLRAGVLAELRGGAPGRPESIAFAHHVLFDYAVSRLLLGGDANAVIERLGSSDEFILLARPSLALRLTSEWEAGPDREAFWRLALELVTEVVPQIAQLVPPAVAVERAANIADFNGLLEAFDRGDPRAPFLLRHVIGARAAMGLPSEPLAGADLRLWSDLALLLGDRVTESIEYPLRLLVWGLSNAREQLDAPSLDALGRAARALLQWAWQQDPEPWVDVQLGLTAVSRSCRSDPLATERILQRVLSEDRLPQFGYRELRPIASELSFLSPCLPDLAAKLYEAAFGHEETSEESTEFGSGKILRLTSNRRQDWQSSRYVLAEGFRSLVDEDHGAALRALAAACESEAMDSSDDQQSRLAPFELWGQQTGLIRDHSSIWDRGDRRGNDAVGMLNTWEATLQEIDEASAGEADVWLHDVAEQPRPAAIWRRVFSAGVNAPRIWAPRLLGPCQADPILLATDTTEPVGRFLAAAAQHWDGDQRSQIEKRLLDLPLNAPDDRVALAERVRDQLLGCLPRDLITTDSARQRLEELDSDGGPPSNDPPFSFTIGAADIDPDEHLRDRGIDSGNEHNREILDLIRPTEEFASAHSNTPPSAEEAREAVSAIRGLQAGIAARRGSIDAPLLQDAEAWLAEAAAALAAVTPLDPNDEVVHFTRQLAIAAALAALPVPRDDATLEQFDSGPSWGVPSGRIDAARALLLLSREPALANDEVLEAIEALAHDRVPAVRFTIARFLGLAVAADRRRIWQLVEWLVNNEPSAQVLEALLHPISTLVADDPDRAFGLARSIYDREAASQRRDSLLSAASGLLLDGWIWRGHHAGRDLLDEWVANIDSSASVARGAFFRFREPSTHGGSELSQSQIRERTITAWADLTRAAQDSLEAHMARAPLGAPSADEQERLTELASLIDASASEFYFASGAYGEKNEADKLQPEIRRRFYVEADPLLAVLVNAGIPAAAHHVLEALASLVDIDPRGVLLRIGEVLSAAKSWGYQSESLAETEVVSLVERYLASHRDLLMRDRESRAVLINALQAFVEAGSSAARRLLYGLDDMFR